MGISCNKIYSSCFIIKLIAKLLKIIIFKLSILSWFGPGGKIEMLRNFRQFPGSKFVHGARVIALASRLSISLYNFASVVLLFFKQQTSKIFFLVKFVHYFCFFVDFYYSRKLNVDSILFWGQKLDDWLFLVLDTVEDQKTEIIRILLAGRLSRMIKFHLANCQYFLKDQI